jgi:hypothetical protein
MPGRTPDEAVEHLKEILDSYDRSWLTPASRPTRVS